MEYIIWSMPMMVLRGITIMPGASTHLDVVNKDSCEAATAAMKNDGKNIFGYKQKYFCR